MTESSSGSNFAWSGSSNGSNNGSRTNGGISFGGRPIEQDAMRAALVHGQLATEGDQRKPQRLNKLPSPKAGKRRKSKYHTMYDGQI